MGAVTWDAATAVAVTLSGGGLVATNTGTTSTNQGVRVANANGKTIGKHYFEITQTVINSGVNAAFGICTIGSTYPNLGTAPTAATVGNLAFRNNGNLWANGVNTAITLTSFGTVGQFGSVAVDLDNRQVWFRRFTNNWNNDVAANPATNTGGILIPPGIMVPFCTFGGTTGVAGSAITANFGATSFNNVVPVGFASGWLEETVAPPTSVFVGGPSGASRGRMIRRRERERETERKRDEIEELIDAVIAQPAQQIPQIPQPPPPALVDLMPKMEAVGLTPPQRKIVKRAIVTDDPDDDEEAIELLLNLLS